MIFEEFFLILGPIDINWGVCYLVGAYKMPDLRSGRPDLRSERSYL